jgi:hypothetical protein
LSKVVKKVSKSCQKVVKKVVKKLSKKSQNSQRCKKLVKIFVVPGKNQKKVNCPEKNKKKKIIGIP